MSTRYGRMTVVTVAVAMVLVVLALVAQSPFVDAALAGLSTSPGELLASGSIPARP